MQGTVLVRTYFLAGRATRLSRNGALAMVSGAARALRWTTHRVVSSAGLLNPFRWKKVVTSTGLLSPFGKIRDGLTGRGRLRREFLAMGAAEQRRIGQDLHDGVGQILSGVAFMSRALERKLAATLGPEDNGAADAAQIAKIAEEAMAQTRSMARVLNPVRLEAGGLTSALGEMASDFEKVFGVTCTLEHDAGVTIDDDAVATHLYRIAQEATTNAVRHGRAKHILIGLSCGSDQGTLTVQDDGTGFSEADTVVDDAGRVRSTETPDDAAMGMGLPIMNHRARVIGGELTIRRRPEGGALIMCVFPRTDNQRQESPTQ
ncbi:MAG: sensor histidine kinase [Planctomycetota bacterium]|jgi:signal transduction histidine kinase